MTLAADLPLPPARPPRGLRAAWTAAHTVVPGVPRWVRIAAFAIPFTVLPSSAWRIATCTFHAPLDGGGVQESGNLGWLPIELYVVLLSVVSEVLAFAAVGLIAPWGEVFPRWIPGLRGRRVPVAAAVVPAGLGAAVLTVVPLYSAVMLAGGRTLTGQPLDAGIPLATHDWRTVVLVVCYAPLLLWGPMLAAVTVGYWRRRRGNPLDAGAAVPAAPSGRGTRR
ncbi:hypothetical protein RMN57_02960 [Kitasatospora sp. CM 4170]|uniref:Uncharacterized protein n=1 Tax=Kitasatospora aburaviensis TaxID=67265 RepID=A0ABW1EY21_9ACTN|nr:hypothetical protein [Kitasatospora sp. CM 4170]WNM43736.1 hypothetical protein RMN57_02960 [Kitasatospora sp. CM 4170]